MMKPASPVSPTLQADSLPLHHWESPSLTQILRNVKSDFPQLLGAG